MQETLLQAGQLFGDLTAIRQGTNEQIWICKCICGKELEVTRRRLLLGRAKSCGCKRIKSSEPPVGQKFGRLTVLGLAKKKYYWLCKCECGNKTETATFRVLAGSAKSCGCIRREAKQNLTGKRFGRLVVIKHLPQKQIMCLCKCDCGSPEKIIHNKLLLAGQSTSCGCYRLEQAKKANTKHGKNKSKVHRIWRAMKGRCENQNNDNYKNYGGRGIFFCEEWRVFQNFYNDMGDPPVNGTLERIDNNGPYAPWNCRWATRAEQVRNRRNSIWITFNEKTQILADWAVETGIPVATLRYRYKTGWPLEKMFASNKKEA
jgi:hypothetical protein